MKSKTKIVIAVLAVLLLGTGVLVYKVAFAPKKPVPVAEEEYQEEILPEADASILVSVTKSKAKDNTVVLKVEGLGGKIAAVAYELTYDIQGLIKGVNSGSKPIETAGQESFEREVYLGTCSRNVCKPDLGVKTVSVVLEFTDTDGKKSQLTKDFEL